MNPIVVVVAASVLFGSVFLVEQKEEGFHEWYCAQGNYVNKDCEKPPVVIKQWERN